MARLSNEKGVKSMYSCGNSPPLYYIYLLDELPTMVSTRSGL